MSMASRPLTVTYKARLGQGRAWSSSNRQVARTRERRDKPTQAPTVPRTARLLALAHYVERAVLDGTCPDYATAARALGMSQPRMSQILDLAFLALDIQEALLDGSLAVSERRLRDVLVEASWDEQRTRLDTLPGD